MADVVIDVSLNQSALNSAITFMVEDVDRQLKQLSSVFDENLSVIEQKMKGLKKGNDTTSNTNREQQAVKELATSYDELASATKKALDAKGTRQNALSFVSANMQNYRNSLAQITQQLSTAEEALKQAIDKKVEQLTSKIEQDKAKVRELQQELVKLQMQQQQSGNFSMFQPDQLRIQQQIENKMAHIAELQQKINSMPTTMQNSQEAQKALELRQQQERISQILSEQQQKISGVTLSLDQQFVKEQQIAEILKSKASAQDAYMRATKMPTSTYDEAVAKLERLKLVQEALNRNPILPESNILRLGRVIDETTQKIHKLETSQQQVAQTTSQTQSAINQQAQNIRQTGLSAEESARQVIDAESRKQAAIRQTGLDAQVTVQQILASMHQQAMADSDSPIMGIRQLTEAIKQMRNAYYSMGSEQESPIGQALRRDIESAERARQAIKEYNQSLMNLNNQDTLRNASFYELKEQIASLTDQYRWMTRRERESAQGRELIEKFQQLSKSANDVQRALNRPISLDKALGLSASTLDEINYKMQMLRNYLGNINVDNNPKAASEIQQVNKALDDLKAKQQQILGQNKQLQDSNTWLARSFQYMKNRLAFYFTIGASTQFLKNLIEIRSQYEMTERALGILVDSAERGSQIFNELSTMALQSPFTLIELSNAAKQLTAYDVAAKDVVDTTRRLADMASAVGVNIDRLTYALGQVKAYGYLNARDARMFANAGIPLVKQLADYYTELEGRMVSVGDVYDRIKKKAVGYEDTMAVITKMTDEGGKFFDFQAKMADTLRVQLANLTLAWNNMLNEMGKSNSSLLTAPIKGLKSLFSAWKQIEQVFKDVAWVFAGIGLIRLLSAFTMRLIGVKMESYATAVAGKTLGTAFAGVGKAFVALMSNPWTWIIAVGAALADLALNASRVTDAAENLRTAIENSADESIKSLKKFREVNDDAIKDFNAGLLKPDELTKLWDSIREELENSADSSSQIIPQLMSIGDDAERVKTALEWSKLIDETNEALKNMGHNLIKINTDLAWGIFGEGVVSDIKDWASALYAYKDILKGGGTPTEKSSYWEQEEEAMKEIEKVAYQVAGTVEALLGEEGMKDRIKVGEAVARIKQQIKLENPEIQGEIAKLFDIDIDQYLNKRWGDVYDNTTRLWQDLMSEVKKDSSSAFSDLSQEWLDGTEEMTEEQKKAFNDAANHLRETLPPTFRQVLDSMMADLNSRDFRINVGIAFNTKLLDDIQKDFNKHFLGSESGKGQPKPQGFNLWSVDEQRKLERENTAIIQKYSRLNRKQGESDLAWEKRLTDEKKAQNDILKIQERRRKSNSEVVRKDAEQQIADARELIGILDKVADYEKLDLNPDKNKKNKNKTKTNKSRVKEEDLVAKALSQELSVIREMQSAYDKLRKAGVNTTDALTLASSGYDRTLKSINTTLSKYGISPFKAEDFVGSADPHKLLTALQNQLDTLIKSGKVKTASLKDLEMEIKKVTVDAKEYDMKRITDGLNNELGKIKEEYELAVELDANPELGDMFAQAFGIDTTGFPKTVQEAVDMMQDSVDKAIAKVQFGEGIDIDPEDLLNTFDILRDDIDKWSKATGIALDSNVIDAIKKMQKEARDLYTKDAKETISDWQKLLEKYAEYETKRTEIQKQAEKERETARKHGASQEIFDAIDLKERRELAKLEFDEFQKSATWITATGDLSNLTNKALQMLIDRLWEYKRAAKNLDPKDIIKLNNAMRKLRKEQKKDNPFAAFTISMDEAKQRMEQFEPEIQDLEAKIKDLWAKDIDQGGLNDEDQKRLEKYIKLYKELVDLQQESGKVPFVDKMKSIGKIVSSFKDAASAFKQIADSTNDFQLQQAAEAVDDIMGNFEAAERGAETWGGWWGAIIGGVTDAIPKIMKWLSGNASIDNNIKKSQLEVKRLELAYKNLQHAVEQAYGVEQYGMQRQIIAYKKLQLEQLKEQLRLEQSRKSKYRNEEAIISIKSEIIDMENEINDATQNIINDLLGISSVGDFAENLVSSMIDAFKEGEDYMKVFEESFDDMIDNMIMKAIVSRLIGDFINQIFDKIDKNAKNSEKAQKAQSEIDRITKERSEVEDAINRTEQSYADLQKWFDKGMYSDTKQSLETTLKQLYAKRDELDNQMAGAIDAYNSAIAPTPEDISDIQDMVAQGKQGIKEKFDAWMELFGIQFGQNAGDAQLSALQQGISAITEDTASALEAYMNGVSQQVYLQSDLLTQIRDILINFGGDVTIATNAQILLQLQQSFQVQMTIQNVLTGVLNASGLAFRVEMV